MLLLFFSRRPMLVGGTVVVPSVTNRRIGDALEETDSGRVGETAVAGNGSLREGDSGTTTGGRSL